MKKNMLRIALSALALLPLAAVQAEAGVTVVVGPTAPPPPVVVAPPPPVVVTPAPPVVVTVNRPVHASWEMETTSS